MSMSANNDVRHGQLPPAAKGVRDLLAGFFYRKWLIVLTLMTSIVATAVFAMRTPEKYESRMKFLIKNVRLDTPLSSGKEEQVVDNGEVAESEISSEIELLKSRDLLAEVVRQTDLGKPQDPSRPTDIEAAVYKLEKDLILAPVKKANIIEVSYSSTSPQTAARVLQKLGELYLENHLKLHRPPGTSDFFKTQASGYERDLKDAENKFSSFQQQKDAVDIDRQKELTLGRLSEVTAKLKDLDGKIAQDDKRIAALESQLAGMDRRVVTQSRVLPNQYSVERLNTMLVELKNRRIQLLAKFQPEDRIVREVDDQIKETTTALHKATGSTAVEEASDNNPLRQPLETELANVKVDQAGNVALRRNLQDQVQQYQAKLTSLAGSTAVHNELSRQVKQAEETYQLYSRKKEESQIEDALDEKKITNISIAEAPITPTKPNRTPQLLVLVIGMMSGLLLSFGSAFTLELLRETFLTPRELQAFSGYPVLAAVPLQKGRRQRTAYQLSEPIDDFDLVRRDDISHGPVIQEISPDRVRWKVVS
jgi:polysaccharide biosynthesis protein PslE